MNPLPDIPFTRREWLQKTGTGIGGLALAAMMQEEAAAAATHGSVVSPLAAKQPHHPARAKHVVHLFMNGGPSQVDTFDRKVLLDKYDGKTLPLHYKTERKTGVAFKSPFSFKKYGQSGIEVSELFAKTAEKHIDENKFPDRDYRQMGLDDHTRLLEAIDIGDAEAAAQLAESHLDWSPVYSIDEENQIVPSLLRPNLPD